MRVFSGVLTMLLMVGCQTTTATTNTPDPSIHPLTSPVRIGDFPVLSAPQTTAATMSIVKKSGSVSTEITYQGQISLRHEGEVSVMNQSLSNSNVTGRGLSRETLAELNQEMKSLEGTKFVMHKNMRTGQTEMTYQDADLSDQLKDSLKSSTFYWNFIMSGETLQQGQEVINGDFADLIDDAVGQISGRVIGQTLFHERLVVVCNFVGDFHLWNGTQNVTGTLDGSVYIDVITGLPTYSSMEVNIALPNVARITMAANNTTELKIVDEAK